MINGVDPPRIRWPSPVSPFGGMNWVFDPVKDTSSSFQDIFQSFDAYGSIQDNVVMDSTPSTTASLIPYDTMNESNSAFQGTFSKNNPKSIQLQPLSFPVLNDNENSADTASDQTITPCIEDSDPSLLCNFNVSPPDEADTSSKDVFSIQEGLFFQQDVLSTPFFPSCQAVQAHECSYIVPGHNAICDNGAVSKPQFLESSKQETNPVFLQRVDNDKWNVVETAHCNASSEVFLGKPGNGRDVINVAAIPARAIFGSLLHPTLFQRSACSWDLAVGYSISTTPTLNRVLLGSISNNSEGSMSIEVTTEGWLIPERITDVKWLLQDNILVAYGRTLALINKGTGSSITSKRPIIKPFIPCASYTFTDEEISKSIREVEVISGDCDILVSSESSRLSRMSVEGSHFVMDGSYNFGLDGVSSARALPGLPDIASCTLDSGRIFCFDVRDRWEPVHSVCIPFIQKDDTLISHDWLDQNTCVCASFNDQGSFLTYVDIRSTNSVLFRKKLSTLPYDIRTRDGNCLISGEPTFTYMPKGSPDHFNPLPPPEETDYSPNTLCSFIDDKSFLSCSSHINLRMWSLVL